MRVIALSTLRTFWERHPDAEQPLRAWNAEAKKAEWQTPNDIKREYPFASIVGGNRVVFNIGGNKYRLVVKCSMRLELYIFASSASTASMTGSTWRRFE